MKIRTKNLLLPLVATAAAVGLIAPPASATPSPYDVGAERMEIKVNTTPFLTPGSGTPSCAGSTRIVGDIDVPAPPATTGPITGSLNIKSADFDAPFTTGRFQLEASGTATPGTYNASAGTFSGLNFPTITFTIKKINTTTCVPGAIVCQGTATLSVSGGLMPGSTVPLSSGEQVYVNGSGSITSTSSCGFPWGLVVSSGAPLTVGKNPAYSTDPGAVFTQA